MLNPSGRRDRFYRDDATRWVLISYALVQAVVTMLTAFDVIDGVTISEAVTAVVLVLYVAVNELLVKPARLPTKPSHQNADVDSSYQDQHEPPS